MLAGSRIWSAVNKYQNGTAKVAKKAFNMGRSGTRYVAMVTELLRSYWRAHLVESYCKVSNISDTNWLRYLLSYLNKIWLSVWHHDLANLHVCWRALARQLPILYNSENKAKSVGCKIEDMRSRLCFLYPGILGCLWMYVEISIDFEQ